MAAGNGRGTLESDEMIRDLMDGVWNAKTATRQDPNEDFLRAEYLRSDLAVHRELVSDRQYKGIITNGLSDEYPAALITVCRKPKFSVDHVCRTMSAIHRKGTVKTESPRSVGAAPFWRPQVKDGSDFNTTNWPHLPKLSRP